MSEDPDEVINHINNRIPELDITMRLGSNEGLWELMQQSELVGGDPATERRFLALAEQSGWVGTATELAYLLSSRSESTEKPLGPFVLGLSISAQEAPETIVAMSQGLNYWDSYGAVGVSPCGVTNTDKFMERITDTGRPIVFVVPSRLYSYPIGGITRREMEWLMDNPDKANNVFLVFGAYDLIDVNSRKNDYMPYDQKLPERAEGFLKWPDVLLEDIPKQAS